MFLCDTTRLWRFDQHPTDISPIETGERVLFAIGVKVLYTEHPVPPPIEYVTNKIEHTTAGIQRTLKDKIVQRRLRQFENGKKITVDQICYNIINHGREQGAGRWGI